MTITESYYKKLTQLKDPEITKLPSDNCTNANIASPNLYNTSVDRLYNKTEIKDTKQITESQQFLIRTQQHLIQQLCCNTAILWTSWDSLRHALLQFIVVIPTISLNLLKLSSFSGFVIISATWSAMLQYSKSTVFSLHNLSRIEILYLYVYFFHEELGFFESFMVELLSHKIAVAFSCFSPIVSSILLSHTAWQLLADAAMNFASAVDRETTGYFLEHQPTAPDPSLNT